MIINPIIPIPFMILICLIMIIFIIEDSFFYNRNKSETKDASKKTKEKINNSNQKQNIVSLILKISIVVLFFITNLRFMLPNGESDTVSSDLSVLFVIDKSVSMRALDYDGTKERFEGVKNDLTYVIDELSGANFSIITFGDTSNKLIPFTTDSDMVQAEIKSIQLENNFYAKGTSLNIVKDILEKTVKDEYERKGESSKIVVFFVTDGEITVENEKLADFSSIKAFITDGAVLGYGSIEGGKMVDSLHEDDPTSDFYYIYYYDDDYNRVTDISKLDDENLKNLSNDLGIDYIGMSKQSNIDYKLKEMKKNLYLQQNTENKVTSYQDIYYYFAIPLLVLLIIDFIKKFICGF